MELLNDIAKWVGYFVMACGCIVGVGSVGCWAMLESARLFGVWHEFVSFYIARGRAQPTTERDDHE